MTRGKAIYFIDTQLKSVLVEGATLCFQLQLSSLHATSNVRTNHTL